MRALLMRLTNKLSSHCQDPVDLYLLIPSRHNA